jgi:hypothetical protein
VCPVPVSLLHGTGHAIEAGEELLISYVYIKLEDTDQQAWSNIKDDNDGKNNKKDNMD